jgi:hypothetical protein
MAVSTKPKRGTVMLETMLGNAIFNMSLFMVRGVAVFSS